MKRILFLLSHTEKGGGEVVIYNLVKNIDSANFKPFLCHVDFRKGEFIREFKKLGVETHSLGAGRLRNLPLAFMAAWRLGRFIRKNSIDLILTSSAHNHLYAALARCAIKVPVVTYVMNRYSECFKDNPLIVRLALKYRADYYLAASLSCLEPLRKLIPAYIPRKVVYHGIDRDFVSVNLGRNNAIRNQLGFNDSHKLISVIARLQRWKGQDVFIRAASLVIKRFPQARFCLVGGTLFGMEEGYPEELKKLIATLGLNDYFRLTGHQEDVRGWILASDIIVHSSRQPEPGAVAIMEAMSLGRPVVATSCGAPAEIIQDKVTGLLCRPDSPEDLADKIMRLASDEKLAGDIGAHARQAAQEQFNATRMAREIEDVFRSIL